MSAVIFRHVAYGNGVFVTYEYGYPKDTSGFAYSSDGINWTTSNFPYAADWGGIVFANGKFIIISDKYILYSFNGKTWNAKEIEDNNIGSIVYGNGIFVGAGYKGESAYSYDGINWIFNRRDDQLSVYGLAYGEGIFLGVSSASNAAARMYMYSTDGISWNIVYDSSLANNLSSIAYGNGVFVCISSERAEGTYFKLIK